MKRLLVDRIGIRDGKIVTQMEIYFSPFYLFRFVRILFVSFWAHSTGDHVGVTNLDIVVEGERTLIDFIFLYISSYARRIL